MKIKISANGEVRVKVFNWAFYFLGMKTKFRPFGHTYIFCSYYEDVISDEPPMEE